jgi:Ribbon-helix-helix protein, copG family
MQTTLRLDDDLYRRAKAQAAVRGISVTKLVEEAIREHLAKPPDPPRRRRIRLPVSKVSGGLLPEFRTLEEAVAAADLADDLRRAR